MTFLIILASFGSIAFANCATIPEITVVNPATSNNNFEFYNYSTPVGTRFNATVRVYEVEDLFAYQVLMNVSANETLLNITNAWLPTWDPEWVFSGQGTVQPSPSFRDDNGDNIIESVLVGDSLLSIPTFYGDGLLAIIEFEIHNATETSVPYDLDIDNQDTDLLDYSLAEMTTIKINGHYAYLNLLPGQSIISLFVEPPARVVVGENVSITGSIIPIQNNVTVTIQYRLNVTGEAWANLTKTQTDSSSKYSFVWQTSAAGEFELKSLWEGDNSTAGAQSPAVFFEIKIESTISLNVSPTNVTAGSIVAVDGAITPTPLAPATVIVQIRLNGTEAWKDLGSTAAVNGIYNYNWLAAKGNSTIVTDPATRSQDNNTFEFRAKWLGDNITFGSESQPPYTTVMVHKTTVHITLTVDPQTVERNMDVTLSGTVQPAIPNLALTLEYSTAPLTAPAGGTEIIEVDVKTEVDGSFAEIWNVGQRNRTDYLLYAYVRISDDVFETTEYTDFMPASLTITGTRSNITISVNPAEASIGAEVTISGRIEPAVVDKRVTIQLGTTQKLAFSDAEGHYSITWKAGNFSTKDPQTGELVINWIAGVYEVSAKWAGDDAYIGATSPTVTITVVRNSTALEIDVDAETITVGSNITITGTLTPAKASIDVTIYVRNVTGQEVPLATVQTDSSGGFSYIWSPDVAGEYALFANWTGDAIDAPAESQVITMTVEPSFTFFTYLPYIAAGAAVVIIAIIAYIYLKKKRTS